MCENGCIYLAFIVAICESMAGVGRKRRLLSGGTGFPAIPSFVFFALDFFFLCYYCNLFCDCNMFMCD